MAEKLNRLYGNQDFMDVIILEYINYGINDFALNENIDNEAIRDELKSRKNLNDKLYAIINEAELLREEQKKENK